MPLPYPTPALRAGEGAEHGCGAGEAEPCYAVLPIFDINQFIVCLNGSILSIILIITNKIHTTTIYKIKLY
jgi:hypothetical protein